MRWCAATSFRIPILPVRLMLTTILYSHSYKLQQPQSSFSSVTFLLRHVKQGGLYYCSFLPSILRQTLILSDIKKLTANARLNMSKNSLTQFDVRMISAASIPRCFRTILEKTFEPKTFTRFLDLPRELQIQIWEYAIKDNLVITDGQMPRDALIQMLHPFTNVRLAPPRGERHAWVQQNLWVPIFHSITRTCRSLRLIGFEWWRRVSRSRTCQYGWEYLQVRRLEKLILDLRVKLEGSHT